MGVLPRAQNWDEWFLNLAKFVAETRSKDPSTKVGAVLARGKQIVSIGYNGFPAGVEDDERLDDRSIKYEIIIHAEINAILKGDPKGATIYTWPLPPCSRCAAILIQAGVQRIVAPPAPPHWSDSCRLSKAICEEAGVQWDIL